MAGPYWYGRAMLDSRRVTDGSMDLGLHIVTTLAMAAVHGSTPAARLTLGIKMNTAMVADTKRRDIPPFTAG